MFYIIKCNKKIRNLCDNMYGVVRGRLFVIEIFECVVKMDEDQ